MNRLAFAEIETIHVRVEERRLWSKGTGNWRVYEYTGLDAIPAIVEPAFGVRDGTSTNVLVIQDLIQEMYQSRTQFSRFEVPYEVALPDGDQAVTVVSRNLVIAVRYRPLEMRMPKAA